MDVKSMSKHQSPYHSWWRRGIYPLAATVLGAILIAPGVAAAANNIGGGTATGTVHFTQPVPPLGQTCAPTSFTLSGGTDTFTLTTVDLTGIDVSGYGGYLTFSGSGSSGCESAEQGSGSLTISAKGDDSVSCPTLTGTYIRLLSHVDYTAAGGCTINGVPAQISFTFQGEFAPTNNGGGVTAPITDATFAGAVAVFPA
jgi:hypothetical protein